MHCVNKNENARKAHFYKSLLWAIDATPRPKCFHRSDFRMLGPRETKGLVARRARARALQPSTESCIQMCVSRLPIVPATYSFSLVRFMPCTRILFSCSPTRIRDTYTD